MLLLSTLVACLHLGLLGDVPTSGAQSLADPLVFSEVRVYAPVAERGIDEMVRSGVVQELAARGIGLGAAAGSPSGDVMLLTVTAAALDPALRGDPGAVGGGTWYRARLVVDVSTASRQRTFSVSDWVPETGGVPDRTRAMEGLARRLAAEVGAWAASEPEPSG